MTYDADATSGYCRPWAGPPQCGYHSHAPLQANHSHAPLQATAVYCDPTLTDPPQLCPGGLACPDCGSNRCACPTGPSPSPTPPAPGNCQAFDHKNSKSYRSQWQGSDTESWGGCCAQCGDGCSGWTYVYNGAPGAKGQCWLKTGVGDPGSWDYDPNVISGLPASGLRGAMVNSSQMQATAVYCDPTLTDPPQLCPGGLACPDCGSNRCACPTGPSPSPTPPTPQLLCESLSETDPAPCPRVQGGSGAYINTDLTCVYNPGCITGAVSLNCFEDTGCQYKSALTAPSLEAAAEEDQCAQGPDSACGPYPGGSCCPGTSCAGHGSPCLPVCESLSETDPAPCPEVQGGSG